jgi:hypothetical protein
MKLSHLDSELAGCVPTVTFKLTPGPGRVPIRALLRCYVYSSA